MAKLSNIPTVSTDLFTYHGESRCFSTEESTLRGNGFSGPARIYDDACDEGFYLVSRKTGKKILFVHSETVRDSDGDISNWVFSAYCLYENPEDLLDLKITIWND